MLQELDFIGGGLFKFQRTLNMRTDNNEIFIDFLPNEKNTNWIPLPKQMLERRERTKKNYLNLVHIEHEKFLKENNLTNYEIEHEKCWHPNFNLNQLNIPIKLTPLPKDNTKINAESMIERYSRDLTESRLSIKNKKLNLGETLTESDRSIFARSNIIEKLKQAGLLEIKKDSEQASQRKDISKEDIKTKLRYIKNKTTGKMELDRKSVSNLGQDLYAQDSNMKLQRIQERILKEIKKKEKEEAILEKETRKRDKYGFLGPEKFKKVIIKINWYFRSRKVSTAFYVKLRDYIRKNMARELDNFQIKGIIEKLVEILDNWIEFRKVPQGLLVKIKKHQNPGELYQEFISKFINKQSSGN
jgi:hypothetical protein